MIKIIWCHKANNMFSTICCNPGLTMNGCINKSNLFPIDFGEFGTVLLLILRRFGKGSIKISLFSI